MPAAVPLGVTTFLTDQTIDPAVLAREVEDRGFHSMYVPEHTHIPTSRRTPAPMGGELAPEYSRTLDPFVALAAAAAVTTRIKIGTAICLVAQHDPILTAKEVATLDRVSGGRFVFGIGFGWNREEMEDHGADFAHRHEITREKMLAMQALWTNERAAFDGKFVRFEESWSWPKPTQQPRPPVLIGGGAWPRLFKHIAEYGDGWMPIGGAGVRAVLPRLHQEMDERGRDPKELKLVLTSVLPDPEKLDYYASFGVTEVVLPLPPAKADVVLPVLDNYTKLL
jgi:probable F420-dependent oxidoreductase